MAKEIEKILKQKGAGDVEPSAWQLMDKINEIIDVVNLGDPLMKKQHCCHIGCQERVDWRIAHDDGPDGYTEACTKHVGDLLTDAQEHKVYPIHHDEDKS